jgi:AraC family transcriptional activator of pobA
VTALRHRSAAVHAAPRAGPHASIVARLRERIEQRFRLREPVSVHAAALGVSQTALRVACARMAGRSPAQMLDQRALLEAQRALLYSNLSIAEIGFSIGFADPAYFSRFFQRNMGLSARAYREAQQGANG